MRRFAAVSLFLALLAVTSATTATAGTSQPRIVGGQPVAIADHPWTVALLGSGGGQFCGGTLVAEDRVVTAAHCVAGRSAADIVVLAGRGDLAVPDPAERTSAVSAVDVPAAYQSVQAGADIAVLTLAAALPYPTLPPATAADAALYRPGKVGSVLGWGRLPRAGPGTTKLHAVDLPMVDEATCAAEYELITGRSDYPADAMFCAGYFGRGMDACQGDSGGPFVVDGRLVGIVSWGAGCGDRPGFYTRVAGYRLG